MTTYSFHRVDSCGRKDHQGQELKAYQVRVAGWPIGIVFQTEHSHPKIRSGVLVGCTYSKDWGFTLSAMSRFPQCPRRRLRWHYYTLMAEPTRIKAADKLFEFRRESVPS